MRTIYFCALLVPHLLLIIFLPPYTLLVSFLFFFFFNDTATTEIYTLSLHDALPIYAARIIGPAVAGVLIGRVGVGPVFFINSVSFVGVILTLLRLEARGLPARERRATMLEEIVEGLRYARRTPRLLLALGLVLSVSLFVFNFTVYVPLLARTVLGLGAEGFGFLMASLGVGAVAGALTVGGFGSREPELGRMFLSAAVAFAALLGLGLSRHAWTAAPLLFVTGYFGIMLMATCNTSMQLRAPDALRGRVMSLYTWVTGGVFPIGAFLVGSISQAWGVSAAFLWNGTLGLVTLAGIMLWWRLRARAPRPA